ncbi:class I SAM-dependent methyltransferase [Methanobrevibacter sp.]|uniref:class I SAM-dependent methyltransferase n=1 Tax=Methanobrevibacter sp. TaxID=66852 RepID=UPI0025D114A7|nr:class I SAM-dependent methyltransferase [Methanobrevibacter sp.]MBQ6511375.1 class I SAM-dependent methyltransferase [Methanobrevibacter sp.]
MFNEKSKLVEKNYCPICNKYVEFKPFGPSKRKRAECPLCGSLERHRLIYLLFQNKFGKLLNEKSIKLLHFAPEEVFYNYFSNQQNIDYYPVDINPELFESTNIKIRQKVNMENMPYQDNEFDFIYNGHVLQCVVNDTNAIEELYRVLKPGGVCITLVPIDNSLEETLEKEEYNTPQLRKKHYGDKHHKRKYSMDIVDKLEHYGFDVEIATDEEILDFDLEKPLYNIFKNKIFICKKNNK